MTVRIVELQKSAANLRSQEPGPDTTQAGADWQIFTINFPGAIWNKRGRGLVNKQGRIRWDEICKQKSNTVLVKLCIFENIWFDVFWKIASLIKVLKVSKKIRFLTIWNTWNMRRHNPWQENVSLVIRCNGDWEREYIFNLCWEPVSLKILPIFAASRYNKLYWDNIENLQWCRSN